MQNLNDMYLYAKVVECGGYTAAAKLLGIPVSRVSRRLTTLEAELGVRLLNRTTRKISVTDVGQTFYQHCAALVAEAEAARDTVDRTTSQPQGLIRMSSPGSLLRAGVGEIVVEYQARHPLVRVQVEATPRRVDVVQEGLDLALRVRTPPFEDSELVVRPLVAARGVIVASPAFLREYGPVDTLAALPRVPLLSTVPLGEKAVWRLLGPDGQPASISFVPRLAVDEMEMLRQAALRGLGVACLPWSVARQDIETGQLRPVLPGYTLPESQVQAVFASRRGLVPAVRGLIDLLAEAFSRRSPV